MHSRPKKSKLTPKAADPEISIPDFKLDTFFSSDDIETFFTAIHNGTYDASLKKYGLLDLQHNYEKFLQWITGKISLRDTQIDTLISNLKKNLLAANTYLKASMDTHVLYNMSQDIQAKGIRHKTTLSNENPDILDTLRDIKNRAAEKNTSSSTQIPSILKTEMPHHGTINSAAMQQIQEQLADYFSKNLLSEATEWLLSIIREAKAGQSITYQRTASELYFMLGSQWIDNANKLFITGNIESAFQHFFYGLHYYQEMDSSERRNLIHMDFLIASLKPIILAYAQKLQLININDQLNFLKEALSHLENFQTFFSFDDYRQLKIYLLDLQFNAYHADATRCYDMGIGPSHYDTLVESLFSQFDELGVPTDERRQLYFSLPFFRSCLASLISAEYCANANDFLLAARILCHLLESPALSPAKLSNSDYVILHNKALNNLMTTITKACEFTYDDNHEIGPFLLCFETTQQLIAQIHSQSNTDSHRELIQHCHEQFLYLCKDRFENFTNYDDIDDIQFFAKILCSIHQKNGTNTTTQGSLYNFYLKTLRLFLIQLLRTQSDIFYAQEDDITGLLFCYQTMKEILDPVPDDQLHDIEKDILQTVNTHLEFYKSQWEPDPPLTVQENMIFYLSDSRLPDLQEAINLLVAQANRLTHDSLLTDMDTNTPTTPPTTPETTFSARPPSALQANTLLRNDQQPMDIDNAESTEKQHDDKADDQQHYSARKHQ